MLRPSCGQGLQTTWGLDVPYDTDDDDWRGLYDCHSLSDLLAMHLGSRTVNLTHDVGHACLVAHERREMTGLRLVVLREGTNVSSLPLCPLAGKEAE